jgi:hypothetical protein
LERIALAQRAFLSWLGSEIRSSFIALPVATRVERKNVSEKRRLL